MEFTLRLKVDTSRNVRLDFYSIYTRGLPNYRTFNQNNKSKLMICDTLFLKLLSIAKN